MQILTYYKKIFYLILEVWKYLIILNTERNINNYNYAAKKKNKIILLLKKYEKKREEIKQKKKKLSSHTGNRTRATAVRAPDPNH